MNTFTTTIFVLLALIGTAVSQSPCQAAYTRCDFRFRGARNNVPTFELGEPDVPFTPRIFSVVPNERLGVLNKNGVALEAILPDGRVFTVSDFGDQNFSPSVIKPVRIERSPSSGLAHETFQGNQPELTPGACIRVFFRQYQILFPTGRRVRRNRNFVGRREYKCVVFRTAE